MKKEKSEPETKLLNKKKEMKELEQNFLKQNQINDKEKNEISQKLNSMTKKYEELNNLYDQEKKVI